MDTKNFIAEKLDRDELIRLIEYHNRRYWDEGEPEIPDARYDELIRALQKLEPDHELVTRVYAPAVAGSGKVRHLRPMLSLDKAYSLEEVLEWAKKFARSEDEELLVEPKYDGISANFDGRVLSTRGDGELGENVTDKLPLVELETAGHTGKVDRPVRGELVIRDDDFKTLYSHIRKKGGGVYKNSRNAVAGIMGLKEIAEMELQGAKITLVDYNLVSFRVKYSELAAKWEELRIRKWKDKIPELGQFTNFHKNKIAEPKNNAYLERYMLEAAYGEVIHFAGVFAGFLVILFFPFRFILCLTLPVAAVNIFFNLPSLFILRYNYYKLRVLYDANERKARRAAQAAQAASAAAEAPAQDNAL